MLVYPQLPTGALAQFPAQRRRHVRTLVNTAADGTAVKLGDPGAATIEWQLQYAGLNDAELSALVNFFEAAEGSLNGFTFVDPTANLLAWSNDLKDAVWLSAPLLSTTGSIADPNGGSNAWQLTNSGAATQSLTQTLNAPGGYVYCLSVYAKASAPTAMTLLLGSNHFQTTLGPNWQRYAVSGTGDPTSSSLTFGIELAAGAVVDVYGLQVEPQESPSHYKPTSTGGCFENARLRDDTLTFTTTDVNRHSTTVHILYASHL
jgi:hypothetical protein